MSGTNYGLVSDKNVGRVGILMREKIFSEDQSTCCLNCWLANSLLKLTLSLSPNLWLVMVNVIRDVVRMLHLK